MSWAGLANNQTISFNNLQNAVSTGVFPSVTPIPVSLKQITKTEASQNVWLTTNYGPFAAKASNQLVVKSDLMIGSQATFSFGSSVSRSCRFEIPVIGLSLTITTSSCVTTSEVNRLEGEIPNTNDFAVNIIFGAASSSEVYDYSFKIYDNATRTTVYDSDSGDAEPGTGGTTVSYTANGRTVGIGYFYELVVTSRSC
jgi:hypothetical protein